MNQNQFQQQREQHWQQLEEKLEKLQKNNKDPQPDQTIQLHRNTCHDLSISRFRVYNDQLQARLNQLVSTSAAYFRSPSQQLLKASIHFFFIQFPRSFRAEWQINLLALSLFLIPALIAWFGIADNIIWAQAILGDNGIQSIDQMWGGANTTERNFDSNFQMFGFYIFNNVGICFRMYAGGILAGLGTLFFLIYNGLFIGAAAAYVHNHSTDPEAFYTFIIAHGSLELTGIIICGAAGLMLGSGFLFPRQYSRKQAIVQAAKRSLPLLGGGATMVFLAAFIEGFWSALPLAANLKYIIGALLWLIVILWLSFSGLGQPKQQARP